MIQTIAGALQGTASETFWASTSYLLTSATFQPILGALSDVFGRREMLLLSVVLFTAGNLINCLANSFPVLLAGRALQGIGGGGIVTLNLVILTDIIPLRQRPKYTGISQMAWAIGSIIGPLVGGAIVQYTTWRWIFYINFPFCFVGLLMIPWVVRLNKSKSVLKEAFIRIDWIGSVLFVASTTSFLIGITWAGHTYPWKSYQTLVPMCLGIAGISITGLWEIRFAASPFIRKSMLQSRALMTAYLCTVLQGLTLYAAMFYLAFYLLIVKARSPVDTGVLLLPISCSVTPASALVGVAVSRLGTWRWAIYSGWIINTLGFGLLIILDESTSTISLVFTFLVLGLGQGLLLSSHNFAVQAIASVQDVAYATALFAFMRGLGVCLGVAIGGTVFQNQLKFYLKDAGLPVGIADNAEAYVSALLSMSADSVLRLTVVHEYSRAFRSLYQVLTGISGAALLLSFTITGTYSLDKELETDHTLEPIASTR